MRGDSESRNLPLLTDVTTAGEAGAGGAAHTRTRGDGPSAAAGAGHAPVRRRRVGHNEPPHREAEEEGLWRPLGNVHPRSPEEKMKRKSEGRRAESRKKRRAAHNSPEAEPNSDIYIEITGKGVCRMNPVNSTPSWQICIDAHSRLRMHIIAF